jgi:bifunctional DNA-binding transcriptional regulator/antitoxin component of YhaV-PrlF toxin-antitoxin module
VLFIPKELRDAYMAKTNTIVELVQRSLDVHIIGLNTNALFVTHLLTVSMTK